MERGGLEMTFLDAHRPLEDDFRAFESAGLVAEALREIVDPRIRPARLRASKG